MDRGKRQVEGRHPTPGKCQPLEKSGIGGPVASFASCISFIEIINKPENDPSEF